ncbi:DUF1844 domain-containing protein [Chloracidobacterium sp. S]|nr:DUF1844 domain-containing protein [Chloracidobacterium sp. S]
MSEEVPSSFKVSDRRLFNPDGTLRTDVEQDTSRVESGSTRSTGEPSVSPQSASTPADQPTPPREDPLFSDFVLELATNAMMMLGLIEHPQYGRLPPDIEGDGTTLTFWRCCWRRPKATWRLPNSANSRKPSLPCGCNSWPSRSGWRHRYARTPDAEAT